MRVRVVLMRVPEEGPPEGTSTKKRREGGREGGREGRTSRMMCWMRWTDSREVFFMLVTSECSAFNFLRISLIGKEEEREKEGAREENIMSALDSYASPSYMSFSLFSFRADPQPLPPSLPHLKMGKSSSTMESTRA